MTAYRPSHARVIQRTAPGGAAAYNMAVAPTVPVDVPAIVAFGGELTNSDSHANSYGKMLYRALAEEKVSGVNVYSVVYDFGSRSPSLERADLFHRAGRKLKLAEHPITRAAMTARLDEMRANEPVPNYIIDLYNILLRPRLFDENGRVRPINTAIKNMRNIMFYGHSHGAAVITQLGDYMAQQLYDAGRTPEQIAKIQRNLLVIQHGPLSPLNPNRRRFNTISFASAEDTTMQNHGNAFARYMSENSADVVPAFFAGDRGNLFVVQRLRSSFIGEHDHRGILRDEREQMMTSDDGGILFDAERNALTRGAKNMLTGRAVPSVRELVNGKTVDFDQMKRNGDALYNIMLADLHQQNLARGNQK